MIFAYAPRLLAHWSNFYVMIGSSAAALTGLMFVVITLVTNMERTTRSQDGVQTFSTPTVLHFAAALLIAAVLSAPWHTLVGPAVLLGLMGLYGVVYVLRVSLRAKRLSEYVPDREDWIWYWILPFVAYLAILIGAIGLAFVPSAALFALAGATTLLIFIGIRNSWDVVTFLATRQ